MLCLELTVWSATLLILGAGRSLLMVGTPWDWVVSSLTSPTIALIFWEDVRYFDLRWGDVVCPMLAATLSKTDWLGSDFQFIRATRSEHMTPESPPHHRTSMSSISGVRGTSNWKNTSSTSAGGIFPMPFYDRMKHNIKRAPKWNITRFGSKSSNSSHALGLGAPYMHM